MSANITYFIKSYKKHNYSENLIEEKMFKLEMNFIKLDKSLQNNAVNGVFQLMPHFGLKNEMPCGTNRGNKPNKII
jgi:carbonic anhydrase